MARTNRPSERNSEPRSSDIETELLDAVSSLTEEIRMLRIVVDELREEVQYGNFNVDSVPRWNRHVPIQSFSLDPTSRDFAVNSVDTATLNTLRDELPPLHAAQQGELFS